MPAVSSTCLAQQMGDQISKGHSDSPEGSLGPGHVGLVEGGREGRLGCSNRSKKCNI